jgi:NitT/TauT family transport system permease protein
MSRLQTILAVGAAGVSLIAAVLSLMQGGAAPLLLIAMLAGAATLMRFAVPLPFWIDGLVAVLLGRRAARLALPDHDIEPLWFWLALVAAWAFAWLFVERLSLAIRRSRCRATWAS